MKSTLTFSNPNWTLSPRLSPQEVRWVGQARRDRGLPDGDFNGISPAKMEKYWVFEQQKWWLNGIKQEKVSLNMISPAQNWVKHWDISWEYRGETWNALQGAPVCQLSWLIAHIIVPFMVDISNELMIFLWHKQQKLGTKFSDLQQMEDLA